MKLSRKQGCLLALVGIPLALYLALRLMLPSYKWHQELTVSVETPAGIVSGSSVSLVSWNKNDAFSASNGPNWIKGFKGEATVVELDNGKYLFALIKGAPGWAYATFKEELGKRADNPAKWAPEIGGFKGQKKDIPRKDYPLLVTFGDINDPASVKQVDPSNLETTFGPGYSLISITLEITSERVTTGKVEEVLGWHRKIPDDFWRTKLTDEQQNILSSVNWVKD